MDTPTPDPATPEPKPVVASFKLCSAEIGNVNVVNPGGWFGKAWLLTTENGHFIVEADSASDAIEEFSDSPYGHVIHVAESDLGDYPEDERHYDGQGRVIDTDNLQIDGQENAKLPFRCQYHGDGLPADGVTPLEYYDLLNTADEIREFIAALPGGLHHPNRRGNSISYTIEVWEAAFAAGRDAGWKAASGFHESQYGDPLKLLLLVRDFLNAAQGFPELYGRAEEFVNRAMHLRNPCCHIVWGWDGVKRVPTFTWHTEAGRFSAPTIPECPEETRFTFQRQLAEDAEMQAAKAAK